MSSESFIYLQEKSIENILIGDTDEFPYLSGDDIVNKGKNLK